MRELAFDKYGCIDFISAKDSGQEITISYWKDEESIKQWKKNSEHQLAQENGRSRWYKSYIVQILEIKREYSYYSKS